MSLWLFDLYMDGVVEEVNTFEGSRQKPEFDDQDSQLLCVDTTPVADQNS